MRIEVSFDGTGSSGALLLVPSKNLITGIAHFTATFGKPTTIEEDLMTVSSAVYAADLANPRGQAVQFCRDFTITIPVINHQSFQRVCVQVERLLYFLTGDNWDIRFVARNGNPEPMCDWPASAGKTLLFSGGLDSFAGAVELLDGPDEVQLVSHVTHNQAVKLSQQSLFGYLSDTYGKRAVRIPIRVGGQTRGNLAFPETREESQRTRSFMFLVLAALVARRSGHKEVIMIAENGQMAIHLPLSAARIGAFSTHTAHPYFVRGMESLLSSVLGFTIEIKNPFLYMTKAETVRKVVAQHSTAIPMTVSCWRASRVSGDRNHCGVCVPCLVRRIALEHNGLVLDEYDRDLLSDDIANLSEDDLGKRNINDLGEFIARFQASSNPDELIADYPELADDSYDTTKAVEMYVRFSKEALEVLRRYPSVRSVVQ